MSLYLSLKKGKYFSELVVICGITKDELQQLETVKIMYYFIDKISMCIFGSVFLKNNFRYLEDSSLRKIYYKMLCNTHSFS